MTPKRVIRLALVFAGILCLGGPFGTVFAATEYQSAVDRWSQLRANPSKLQLRHHWMPVLAGFKEVSASSSDQMHTRLSIWKQSSGGATAFRVAEQISYNLTAQL